MKIAQLICMGALLTSMLPLGALPKKKADEKPQEQKYYTEIKTMEEYEAACRAFVPTVIVYTSPTCSACDAMEPGLNQCAKTYRQAKFYVVNGQDKKFKAAAKEAKIQAYPTTHFLKAGAEPRIERGSMGEQEFDGIAYEFVYGKRKPLTKKRPRPIEIKKSLQEKTR